MKTALIGLVAKSMAVGKYYKLKSMVCFAQVI